MKTAYQESLEKWARGLTDEKLQELLIDDRIQGAEIDALFHEDVRRMQMRQQ